MYKVYIKIKVTFQFYVSDKVCLMCVGTVGSGTGTSAIKVKSACMDVDSGGKEDGGAWRQAVRTRGGGRPLPPPAHFKL